MKRVLLLVVVAVAVACTNGSPSSSTPQPNTPAETPQDRPLPEAEIYAAVIRQLATKDHTFGKRGASPFKVLYVVNGAIARAGKSRGDPFGPAPDPFRPDVLNGIRRKLGDEVPPLRFVIDGNKFQRGHGLGLGVRNAGVIISLGPIEIKKDRVHVRNMLWCGSLCAQGLTYVLSERDGRWVITGTTGPITIA